MFGHFNKILVQKKTLKLLLNASLFWLLTRDALVITWHDLMRKKKKPQRRLWFSPAEKTWCEVRFADNKIQFTFLKLLKLRKSKKKNGKFALERKIQKNLYQIPLSVSCMLRIPLSKFLVWSFLVSSQAHHRQNFTKKDSLKA